MMNGITENRVCIIGAGPVGLTLALRLSDFGIACTLFDDNPGLKKEGSKACLIQGDVLEILDKSGCADKVFATGLPWVYSNVYIGGTSIKRVKYENNNRYGPFVNISQYDIEKIMLEEIERRPNIRVHWSSKVIDLRASDRHVCADIQTPDGRRSHAFAYVAACNGVRSNVRDIVQLKWNGYRHTSQFLITDIRAKLPFAKERHFHFDPPFNRGYQVIIHPQPDDIWRIDWQLAPDVDVEADKANGNFEKRIRSVIGNVDYELKWMSVYRFQQRTVERFSKGRVLFAGDAAHALPPYGSRGMNSGIQDADNLAWKLALVMNGCADSALIDTYHCERAAAARENIDVTERTIRFMVPSSRWVKARRGLLFSLAKRFPSFRQYVNSGTMAMPHRYVDSPIVRAADTSMAVGSFAADADVKLGGRHLKLRELLGKGFTFVYVGRQAPTTLPALQGSSVDLAPLALSAVVLQVGRAPALSALSAMPAPAQKNLHVGQVDESILAHFEHGKWHLVRPDMHIATIADFTSADQFEAALRSSMALADKPWRREEAFALA